jgi:hypothetical protein
MLITGDTNYRDYTGVTTNPQFEDKREQVMEKNAKVMLPVGHEAVQARDYVMPDIDSLFSTHALDVIPQVETYQWVFQAHTAITAAVNLLAGYAVGSMQILIDTISVAYALRPGHTISITTGGTAYYYLIKDVDYTVGAAAGADCLLTLAWPIATVALVNNDVITTAHAADAPIYFPFDSPFYEMLKEIELCVQFDVSVPDADVLPVVAYAAGGIAVDTVAMIPSGGLTHPGSARGNIGLMLGTALVAGDSITLTAKFYDKVVRSFTVGRAEMDANVRTSGTVWDETLVALK